MQQNAGYGTPIDQSGQPLDLESAAQNDAKTLAGMTEQQRADALKRFDQYPAYKQKVVAALSSTGQGNNAVDMRPMPEQRPPRRNGA